MPLWSHQQTAKDRAKDLNYFGLFFDMGTGKTRTVIEILNDRYAEHGRTLKTLIVTPLVVVENFCRELKHHCKAPVDKIVGLTGEWKKRVKKFDVIQGENVICVTNYESLYNKDFFQRVLAWQPECLVLDELHKIKDIKSRRTKLCLLLSATAKYRYGLSGTPILNTQADLFSQIGFLDQGATFGKNFYAFRGQYFYDANAARKSTTGYFPNWLPRPGIDLELKRLIAPFTMTAKKSECLDLPPLVVKEVVVGMGDAQAAAYKAMKKDFIAYLNDKACVAELAVTKSLRLQQIVSGFIKLEDGTENVFNDVPRTTVLRDLLEDITLNHKVIVWCAFKKNYEMVETVCKSLGVKYTMLHGGTVDKWDAIYRFQNIDDVKVMVANPAAGGIGVNMTAASYMIYFSKTYSLEHDLQSEARCYRGGSEVHESITRIDLVSLGTIDELIKKLLAEKKELGNRILGTNEILSRLRNGLWLRSPRRWPILN